ncbi:hypothetical protein MGI18_25305 [Bacillus sp. OVS6]|nr:hypothetical protein MGI18_25305 [Bacillus sp. OVS6]
MGYYDDTERKDTLLDPDAREIMVRSGHPQKSRPDGERLCHLLSAG